MPIEKVTTGQPSLFTDWYSGSGFNGITKESSMATWLDSILNYNFGSTAIVLQRKRHAVSLNSMVESQNYKKIT